MTKSERGSEIVQAVVAVPLLLLVVFAVMQFAGMMLTVNRVSADVVRACSQIDAAGLSLASDKEEFIKSEILGSASLLHESQLQVSKVSLSIRSDENTFDASSGARPVSQRARVAQVAFDVSYNLPTLISIPGIEPQTITRHVECVRTTGKIVEVEVTP